MMSPSSSQRGIALITALLVVALSTIAAVAIASRLQLDIRRSSNLLNDDQAWMYALAAEGFAARLLREDMNDGNIDHLEENWSTEKPEEQQIFPVEGGIVSAKLVDLNGKFNLNTLLESVNTSRVDRVNLERFRRLLITLQLEPTLSDALIDYLDNDQNVTLPDGAEDAHYLTLPRPYRTADRVMSSVSELRLVKGFDDDKIYQTLLPFVCVLPDITSINVNTAPAEVLKSLDNHLTDADVEALIEHREDNPFKDTNEFLLTVRGLNQQVNQANMLKGLDVRSNYFLLHSNALIGRGEVNLYSVLRRENNGNTSTISRARLLQSNVDGF